MTNKTEKIIATFDMDGTILDSMPKMRADTSAAMQRLGYTITTEEQRMDWKQLITKYNVPQKDFDREFDKRKSWEQSLRDGEAPLFPDAIPCLETLASQGVTLALLTKSLPEYTRAKLDYHRLNKYFGDRVAVTPVTAKDKIREARDLIRKTGTYGNSFYFIGDRAEDVLAERAVELELPIQIHGPANVSDPTFSYGIWLNRTNQPTPEELRGYKTLRSLNELPRMVLGK